MENHRSFCPLNLILEMVGDKWSLLILRDIMFENKRHFRQLLQLEEKIASNILADRLNGLERNGLLKKTQDPNHKQKFIYSLTEKAIDLLPMLIDAMRWSLKYEPVDETKYEPAVSLIKGGEAAFQILREKLFEDHINR